MTKILVIDDKKDDLILVKALLKHLKPDCEVLIAQSGIEGIKLAKSKQPDTILLDVHMPRIDGYEVCRRLRADKKTEHIPIIFLTAVKTSPKDRIEGLELGVDAYLTKPIDEGELLATLHAMLRIKKVEDELAKEKDLLEVKVAERTKELQESEDKFIDLYDYAPDMFASVDAKTSKILRCNQTLVSALGYNKDEIIGQPVFFIYHPDCIKEAKKYFQQFVDTGKVHDVELQLKRKDGTKIDVSLNVSAVRDEEGKVLYSRSIWRDITERKRAEEALREREQQLSQIYDSVGNVLFYMAVEPDDCFLFLSVNQVFLEATGLAEDQIVGKRIEEVIPEPSLSMVRDNYKKAIKEKRIVRWEETTEYPTGVKVGEVSIAPIFDDGICTHLVGSVHDITERKQAEEALRGSEERFRSLYENSTIGLYRTKPDGRILLANPALVQMLGYSSFEELSARNLEKEGFEIGYSRSEFIKRIEREGQIRGFKNAWRKSDGTLIYIRESAKVIRDEKGAVRYYEGTVEDITERKRVEEELRKGEERYRSVLDTMDEGYYEVDLKGNFTFFNDSLCRMLNYSRDELMGMNNRQYMERESAERVYKAFNKIFRTGKSSKTVDFKIKRKEGGINFGEISISLLKDRNSKHVGFRGIVRDITERKQAEEELKNSEERYKHLSTELEAIFDLLPALIFYKDTENRFIRVNKYIADSHKMTKKTLEGKNLFNIYPKDQAQAYWDDDLEVINSGKPKLNIVEPWETAKGAKWVDTSKIPFVDEKGDIIGIIGISIDITERKQAEENLKASTAILEESQRIAKLGSYAMDITTGNWTSSEILDKLFGIEKDYKRDVNGWAEIIHPDERTEMLDYFTNHVITERQPFDKEYRIIRKNDQQERWVHGLGKLEFDADGNPVRMIGTIQDITERKTTEEELRVSQEYAQNLIDSSLDMIIAVDKQRWITEFNRAAEETFGYKKEEVLGKHINMLYADVEEGRRVHRQTVEQGQMVQEILNKRKDGETFPVLLAASILLDEQGDVTGVMGVSRDISEQKAAEQTLKESEKKFRIVIEHSNDGIYVLQGSRFVFINPRFTEITGFGLEETSAKDFNFKKLVAKEGLKVLKEREALRKRGEEPPSRFVFKGLRKDGGRRDLEVSVTTTEWQGAPATLGVLHDVTKRIQARAELEQAVEKAREGERVKSLFLSNMSHEIRTPLNAILGFTELIENSTRHLIGAEEKVFFDTIRNNSNRLMRTVHEILDISQIEAKTLPVILEEFDLAELVEKAVKPMIYEAKAKGLELHLNTTSMGIIWADEYCVVQAVVNLVENAIKYTEKGRIDIDLKEKTDTMILSVRDTGIGIGAEYLKEIFHVFTQVSTGYTKKYQGVGLGLALVKNYLDLCDATIAVKSKKNVGSMFTITFKKMKTQPKVKKEVKPAEKIEVHLEVSKYKPQVLVVEDDESSQRLISFFLRDHYELEFAVSVLEAKKKLERKKVELVLLDLSLIGNEDGLDLARYMRKAAKWQKTPIIATTAHAFTTDRDKCLKAGCNAYLAKPIMRGKLIEKMKQQLNLS